jgi:hypothetical protein
MIFSHYGMTFEHLTVVHIVEPLLLVCSAGAQLGGLVAVLARYRQATQVVGTLGN